jgi:hypothetical protein
LALLPFCPWLFCPFALGSFALALGPSRIGPFALALLPFCLGPFALLPWPLAQACFPPGLVLVCKTWARAEGKQEQTKEIERAEASTGAH